MDYYLSLNSPWAYLGSERLAAIAARHSASVAVKPVDFGTVFPASGGVPLLKRAPQRQAYRLVELERWSSHLEMPIVVQPAHFPIREGLAAGMVVAAREAGHDSLGLAHAILRALWREDRNTGDAATLEAIAAAMGLDGGALLARGQSEEMQERYRADTLEAISRGVFGAPSYVLGHEIFWGQDRLDFLDRALARSAVKA